MTDYSISLRAGFIACPVFLIASFVATNASLADARLICLDRPKDEIQWLAACESAISRFPKDSRLLVWRAQFWTDKGELSKAIRDYTTTIIREPNYGYPYQRRCELRIKLKQFTEARSDCETAVRLDSKLKLSDTKFAIYHLAFAAESIGDKKAANDGYRRFLAIEPSDPAGLAGLRRTESRLAKPQGMDHSGFPQPQELVGQLPPMVGQTQINVPEFPQNAYQEPQLQASAAPQGRRVALVIGNVRYKHAGLLKNPARDAQLLAAALREKGFQSVSLKVDLSREQTIQALKEFAAVADAADWSVVYYSGHGIEFGGVNYIIPVEARLESDRDIDLEAVDVGKIISAIQGTKKLKLVILDACRTNPFASQMRRTVVSRSIGRGLGRAEPEAGTLIAYAAKHGEVALDGADISSPFAKALVSRIKQAPPIEIRRLFDLVRDDVLAATNNQQQPFHYGSVSGSQDFYFSVR